MKPTIVGIGKVSRVDRLSSGKTGKPFLGIVIDHKVERMQYPMRVKAVLFGNDIDTAERTLSTMPLIQYVGEADAEGYQSTRGEQKIIGVIKVFIKSWEVVSEGTGASPESDHASPAQPSTPRIQRPSTTHSSAQAAEADDVPF